MTCHRPHPLVLAALLVLTGLPAARAAEAPTADRPAPAPAADTLETAGTAAERDAAYRAFRRDYDAQRFAEALPHAERVVVLTEQLDSRHPDLPRALNNLGATQVELHDYLAAEKAYGRALVLIEEAHGGLSPRLLAPLRGLALTYQGTGHAELAVPLLERAVAVSRRSHGLFNPAQRELLMPLVEAYVQVGRVKDADRVEQYALQIAEHEFGTTDLRLYPALQQLGRWYLRTAQRNQAREVWERLRTICTDPAQANKVCEIVALRGIAESYRLDYQFGFEPPPQPRPGEAPMPLSPIELDAARRAQSPFGPEYVLASAGEEALSRALRIAEHLDPPSPIARAVVLVDLGDWQQLGGRLDRALPYYQRALPLLPADSGSAESAEGPLSRPALLLYRPPAAAERRRDQPAALVVEKYAIAEFTVTEEGKVRDARVVEGDATDSQRSAFLSALGRAIYRPRFADGKPAATDNVRLRESFRQAKS